MFSKEILYLKCLELISKYLENYKLQWNENKITLDTSFASEGIPRSPLWISLNSCAFTAPENNVWAKSVNS